MKWLTRQRVFLAYRLFVWTKIGKAPCVRCGMPVGLTGFRHYWIWHRDANGQQFFAESVAATEAWRKKLTDDFADLLRKRYGP